MRAGDLRNHLLIQRPTVIESPTGAVSTTEWEDDGFVWAAIRTSRGYEQRAAGTPQVATTWTHEIRARYSPYLNNTCRLIREGRIFEIVSVVDVDDRHLEMVIQAVERGTLAEENPE
ncbi:MAG: phage head-tail adaptor [Phycisphaerales bacterium]|nr:phage head-tail adaptor [Phycisphaerales bacterium]